jgi:hypothetical protein
VTPQEDCRTNEWSFVAAYSGGLSATHEAPSVEPDVDVQYLLVGVRDTFGKDQDKPVKAGDLVPFWHVLVGGVRRRELGTAERFGRWGSGGAATGSLGLELVLFSQSANIPNGKDGERKRDPRLDVRLRAQSAFAVYGIGDRVHKGAGYAVALSVGWIID